MGRHDEELKPFEFKPGLFLTKLILGTAAFKMFRVPVKTLFSYF